MPDTKSEVPAAAGFMQVGLLLETVQEQQRLTDGLLAQLDARARGLDAVLRETVRRVLVEELNAVGDAGRQATEVLRTARRQASLRVGIWSVCAVIACSAVPAALAWALVPTRAQISAMRQQYQDLAARVERLKAEGSRVDIRRCGAAPRLCVRVDRKAPAYGEAGDYLVIKGY